MIEGIWGAFGILILAFGVGNFALWWQGKFGDEESDGCWDALGSGEERQRQGSPNI